MLVTRLRRIGDVILSLPVVDAIREAHPGCAIDYLAEEGAAEAARGHPAIDRLWVLRHGAFHAGLPASPRLLLALRARGYDWVVDLYGNPRSALLTFWTGARVRIGPARRGRRRLYTHPVSSAGDPLPAVEHHLRFLEEVGIRSRAAHPRIHLTGEERSEGARRLGAALPPGPLRVGLHVWNRWPAKRWPEERFAGLLRALPRIGARGVVLAGPGEEAAARRVAAAGATRATPAPAIVAGLPLRLYWGVVAALDALVTNDGSPLHAGPALGVPTVGILGPTEPAVWFPHDEREGHQLLCREIWCRPCHRHECARMDCLHWIEVEDALRATERALRFGEAARAQA